MNKLLHMNSFFTKIILAVLAFAVILCIFIPYAQVDGVKPVHDINVEEKTMDLNIGANEATVNLNSEFFSMPYKVYTDETLAMSLDVTTKLEVAPEGTTYYLQINAYGYTPDNDEMDTVDIGLYKLVLDPGTPGNQYSKLTFDRENKVITVDVPAYGQDENGDELGEAFFDMSRLIDPKKPVCRFQRSVMKQLTDRSSDAEVSNIEIDAGQSKAYYTAVTIKSEGDPSDPADNNTYVYYPLDMYTTTVNKDEYKFRLPQVGEIGIGILSSENGVSKFLKSTNYGKLSRDDTFMFIFLALGAIACLCSFIIPAKFRAAELVLGELLGAGLIVMPFIDWMLFFGKNNGYHREPGWFILIALGVLIMLVAVFDYIRCRSEYKAEQIRIYGEDVFKKKK